MVTALIADEKPSLMVELGGYVGYSAILFGDAVRRAGGQKYISLELNPVNAAIANLLIDLAGLRDFISIVIAPAHLSLARLLEKGVLKSGIDMLFIDHWKQRYLPDLWLIESLGLLKPGKSIIVADNILHRGLSESDYIPWVEASPEEKQKILQKHTFKSVAGIDIRNTVINGGVEGAEAAGIDLELVPGKSELVYEPIFKYHTGRDDAKEKVCETILVLLCYCIFCSHFETFPIRKYLTSWISIRMSVSTSLPSSLETAEHEICVMVYV